jgi:hypothetical protein
MAVTVQEIVGRLFDPQYRADRASWDAAKLIDQFRSGFSPIQLIWQITGQLHRAWDLLVEGAKRDRWSMHGTAIGVHRIVQALTRMRELRARSNYKSLNDNAVLCGCLWPPKQVPRAVEAAVETPFVSDALQAGTLVMLQLEAAGPSAPDAEMVFMRGHWNECPASAFVCALLRAVWHRSLEEAGSV